MLSLSLCFLQFFFVTVDIDYENPIGALSLLIFFNTCQIMFVSKSDKNLYFK